MIFPLRVLFSLWPGSLATWRRGDARSLLIAILFGLLLSIAWTATTLWPLWLSSWRLSILWCIAGGGAAISVIHSAASGMLVYQLPQRGCPDAALVEAQSFYLQANYYEAERLISPYCRTGAMDAEAALLMASVLRRTGRIPQALALIDELSLLDCGLPWRDEIEHERKLSRRQKASSQPDSH
jgi:hypothetical protein